MTEAHDALADFLFAQQRGGPVIDITERAPDLSLDDAYRVQFALMRKRVAAGDAVIGYKVAYTNKAMQESHGIPEPVLGTLLRSGFFSETEPVRIASDVRTSVEPEVALLMKSDLAGPGVTPADVLRATEGLMPAIEVAQGAVRAKRSRQMGIAVHKSSGGVVLGNPLLAATGLDLRLEGCVISINGTPRASGTGIEVLGNPLHAAAFVANKLGQFGQTLRAGMIVLTGSIVVGLPVVAGDDVLVEFTRMGVVRARFAAA